jgi:predicted flap endonuclease-1-like 5' DNA nuclease
LNGLSLLAVIAVAIAIVIAYRLGRTHARGDVPAGSVGPSVASGPPAAAPAPQADPGPAAHGSGNDATIAAEKTRLVIAYEAEAARLRDRLVACDAQATQLAQFAEDRRNLFRELADARTQLARFRQIVVDIENDAPPPILGERGAPDDLKLIVGVGPVLERMLQQLGIATYRQIARWTEHDIDEMDARLPEFPGRIRRDAWVTQARALHQSKYGERA